MNRTYTLNEYYPNADSTATRAEVYSDNITAANLLAHHKHKESVEVSVWECICADTPNLPMPSAVMNMLSDKIRAINKRVIVTGIDAYLSLLSEQNSKAFLVALHSHIDEGKLNAVYMISNTRFDGKKFSNPKFENSLSVVHISGNGQCLAQPTFTVVSDKWVRSENNPTSWIALLKLLGQYEPTDSYTLVLSNYTNKQAGLSDSVTQLLNITEIADRYYGISVNLPKNVVEILVKKCKEGNCSPFEYLKTQFGENNANTRLAIKRLLELQNDELWCAYIWFIQKIIAGSSYLSHVLAVDFNKDNILRKYVSETAINLLDDPNAAYFAPERAEGIKEVGTISNSLIVEFINTIRNKSNDDVACWLNCGTVTERVEIIHRISESDLTVGLPLLWHGLYPLLEDYLSDKYDFNNENLTAYFRDYRRFKVANIVTEAFVKQAFDTVLPPSFASRDSVLQELSCDISSALLVVDGMGAEYYPLILAMAKRRGMNTEYAAIAAVRLPSSTEFNHLHWDASKILRSEIHEVDNISHTGATKYENCSFEQNIMATLDVFETIIDCIAHGLTNYERIVVTADHGSSRLAVIAHNNVLDKTLPWNGDPQDWRYSVAPPNTECPPEFESYYNVERNTTYWVVRGYNRLPKQGGKLSVHGGATLEERLVPVIVFSEMKTETEPKQLNQHIVEQLVEKNLDI
jgi:hypothetical protein